MHGRQNEDDQNIQRGRKRKRDLVHDKSLFVDVVDKILKDILDADLNPHIDSLEKRKRQLEFSNALLLVMVSLQNFIEYRIALHHQERRERENEKNESDRKEAAKKEHDLLFYLDLFITAKQKLEQLIQIALREKIENLCNVIARLFSTLKHPTIESIHIEELDVDIKLSDVFTYISMELQKKIRRGEVKAEDLDEGIKACIEDYLNEKVVRFSELSPEAKRQYRDQTTTCTNKAIDHTPGARAELGNAAGVFNTIDSTKGSKQHGNKDKGNREEINESATKHDAKPMTSSIVLQALQKPLVDNEQKVHSKESHHKPDTQKTVNAPKTNTTEVSIDSNKLLVNPPSQPHTDHLTDGKIDHSEAVAAPKATTPPDDSQNSQTEKQPKPSKDLTERKKHARNRGF